MQDATYVLKIKINGKQIIVVKKKCWEEQGRVCEKIVFYGYVLQVDVLKYPSRSGVGKLRSKQLFE